MHTACANILLERKVKNGTDRQHAAETTISVGYTLQSVASVATYTQQKLWFATPRCNAF